jgi:hypothetical protein
MEDTKIGSTKAVAITTFVYGCETRLSAKRDITLNRSCR